MLKYTLHRLLLMIPTLFGITVLCFVIINLAPGSPMDQKIAQMRFGGGGGSGAGGHTTGVSNEIIEALKKQYGFDKPMHVRYVIWLKNIFSLDFGESFTYEMPTTELIGSKLPVSLQFGLASLLLTYLISIPVGIWKAVHEGGKFDLGSSIVLMILYSIPPLILGILFLTF